MLDKRNRYLREAIKHDLNSDRKLYCLYEAAWMLTLRHDVGVYTKAAVGWFSYER